MNNFQTVFIAGEHSKGLTAKDLKDIAANYDREFHEAPLIAYHNDGNLKEPPKLAGIAEVKAKGKELLVKFANIADEAKEISKFYSRPSVEIATYLRNGKSLRYLRAVALTNFPQIKGLPVLSFDDSQKEPELENIEMYSSDDVTLTFNNNQTEGEQKMHEELKLFCEQIGISFSEDADESHALIDAAAKFKEINEELNGLKKTRNQQLIDEAIAAGKLLPAQKEGWLKFAEADYHACRDTLTHQPVSKILAGRQVKIQEMKITDIDNPKFFNDSGKRITYKDVMEDVVLRERFSDEEIKQLKTNAVVK